ncbi:autoinducer binding domain-containing protein [Tateyamaria sp. syn59]|uniref:autoinducer binding domain-containing protein n=1 Tax=Tateyamaria sp. syn59 TaxID=2576942 RepID=UPI001CB96123
MRCENRLPESWHNTYAQKSYFLREPMIFWALAHDGMIDWDDSAMIDPTDILADTEDHGLLFGATVATGTSKVRSFCGLARQD